MKTGTMKKAAILAAFVILTASGLSAQTPTPPPQTFSTTIYFDYSFWATNNGYLTNTDPAVNANPITNKFAFRRAYFTYENKISADLKFRFRIDADNTARLTSTSGSKDDKLVPFVKHISSTGPAFCPIPA